MSQEEERGKGKRAEKKRPRGEREARFLSVSSRFEAHPAGERATRPSVSARIQSKMAAGEQKGSPVSETTRQKGSGAVSVLRKLCS